MPDASRHKILEENDDEERRLYQQANGPLCRMGVRQLVVVRREAVHDVEDIRPPGCNDP